ncbi:protein NRT1/ PTR FAMILY 5.10-like isoform X2 [Aristolochia californica]|uniref:protein NRT1/ PTR FAMILY 5.10-like isoform X2 n=1 Tax=Aristolochia californica TaxID=171875 RepID=UPI0035D5D547
MTERAETGWMELWERSNGTGMLTLSVIIPSLRPLQDPERGTCPPATQFQTFFLFTSLYLVAIAQNKPCVQAFGADQFDAQDPQESKSKSSFFNWLNFSLCFGSGASTIIVPFIEDNNSWGLGFGLPCISMVAALAIFLLGTPSYRYPKKTSGLVIRSCRVVGAAAEQVPSGDDDRRVIQISSEETHHPRKSDWSRLIMESKEVLQLTPIWVTCLFYGVVNAQPLSLFTKQGGTMDRRVSRDFQVPAAALQSTSSIMMLLLVPIYDGVFVPMTRLFTKLPSGITMLQRIGIGLLLSIASMVVAAVVESRRLEMARELGLVDEGDATVPMSVWWLLPQFVLYGTANVFVYIGSLEFFYGEMPEGLGSVGIALCLATYGIGSFLSGILISAVDMASGAVGKSWFDSNLNRAHLDYFYWLVAASSAIGFGLFIYLAKSYVYKSQRLRDSF